MSTLFLSDLAEVGFDVVVVGDEDPDVVPLEADDSTGLPVELVDVMEGRGGGRGQVGALRAPRPGGWLPSSITWSAP